MASEWNLQPPPHSELTDREIRLTGSHMVGTRIALLITGSIAAYRTPDLVRDLRRVGADVTVFATKEGLRYVAREALEWNSQHAVIEEFSPDAEHLSDSTPFDMFLIAPASYNTINKAALGIADSLVSTAIAAALGRMERQGKPMLFAPAMHGTMHNSILTRSLKTLEEMGAIIIPPRQTHGKNNLAELCTIVRACIRVVKSTELKSKSLLITGGPTPVPVDSIRHLTTRFTGALAIQIAKEAWFRGANVELVLGRGSHTAPDFLNCKVIANYQEYYEYLAQAFSSRKIDWGIFSSAVADYQPESVISGKLPSKQDNLNLKLVPTRKVIDEIRRNHDQLKMVTFKYEENLSHDELMNIAQSRINESGHQIVVANRGEEFLEDGTQVAWIVEKDQTPQKEIGKASIASAILNRIEATL